MAQKPRNGSGTNGGWNSEIQFAKTEWNNTIEAQYEAWLKHDAPSLEEALKWLVEASYRVSIVADGDGGSVKCSATGYGHKHVNENICITSWGNDPEDAALITLFKIGVLYEGKTAPLSGSTKGGRR